MKAQAEMLNLAIATTIMIVIAAIGLIWYSFSLGHKDETKDYAFIASNLPELQCSFKGTTSAGCIDLPRATLGEGYYGSFGKSRILLNYWKEGNENSTVIYNGKTTSLVRKATDMPVSVYDAGKYYQGKIRVEMS
jgi:hypothetical protein